MNSPYSKIKNAYWLLKQLKRLHHRYRFRKMILMSIPVMLIVVTYLGIQFKDLYQLKNLKLSDPQQQAESLQEENQLEELEAPKVNLADNSLSFDGAYEENADNEFSEATGNLSDEFNEEYVVDHEAFGMAEGTLIEEDVETQMEDTFIAGLSEKTLELGIIKVDAKKLADLSAKTIQRHIPAASPSLLRFKPVPYVRIPSLDYFAEVESELEEAPLNSLMEGEDQ